MIEMTEYKRVDFNELEEVQDALGFWVVVDQAGKLFTGIVYETFADGSLSYEGVHVDGKRCGYEKHWHKNGTLKEYAFVYMNTIHGPVQSWNDKGVLTFEAENSFSHRVWYKFYNDDGKLIDEYNIENDPPKLERYHKLADKIKASGKDQEWNAIFQWKEKTT